MLIAHIAGVVFSTQHLMWYIEGILPKGPYLPCVSVSFWQYVRYLIHNECVSAMRLLWMRTGYVVCVVPNSLLYIQTLRSSKHTLFLLITYSALFTTNSSWRCYHNSTWMSNYKDKTVPRPYHFRLGKTVTMFWITMPFIETQKISLLSSNSAKLDIFV